MFWTLGQIHYSYMVSVKLAQTNMERSINCTRQSLKSSWPADSSAWSRLLLTSVSIPVNEL